MQHCLVCPPLYNSFELECDAAGVPGMVAAMLRHLQSLRLMRWGLPQMLPGAATVLLACCMCCVAHWLGTCLADTGTAGTALTAGCLSAWLPGSQMLKLQPAAPTVACCAVQTRPWVGAHAA